MNWADGAMVFTPSVHLLTLLRVHVRVCVFFLCSFCPRLSACCQ